MGKCIDVANGTLLFHFFRNIRGYTGERYFRISVKQTRKAISHFSRCKFCKRKMWTYDQLEHLLGHKGITLQELAQRLRRIRRIGRSLLIAVAPICFSIHDLEIGVKGPWKCQANHPTWSWHLSCAFFHDKDLVALMKHLAICIPCAQSVRELIQSIPLVHDDIVDLQRTREEDGDEETFDADDDLDAHNYPRNDNGRVIRKRVGRE